MLRRHSVGYVTRDLTAAPQKRQRSGIRTLRGRRASTPPPTSPLTLPEGPAPTSPAAKRPRNLTTTRASPAAGFSMVLRGSASAAFKPTALETFKTPTSTRRVSAITPSSVRVPTFTLSPAARTPTMHPTATHRAGSGTPGVARLPDVTPIKNSQTTPRTSHTMSRQTIDALLFKSPLSPAEYSSPVLKRRRSACSDRGVSPYPAPVATQGKQVTTPSRPGSVISPQDDGSRDSGVCMKTGGGALSPIPFGLISPDLDHGEVINRSFSELASKPISSRRTLFGETETIARPVQGFKTSAQLQWTRS